MKRAVLSAILFVAVYMVITSQGVFSSTSSDIFIVSSDSGAEAHIMKLRAVRENGEVRRTSGFAISIENIISVELNGKVTVFSTPTSPNFTSAKLTDSNNNTEEIPITDTGEISLKGYRQGLYTLDVIVDDRFAFECMVIIGPEEEITKATINKEITEVNKRTDEHDKKIFASEGISKAMVCLFTPSHPICKPDKDRNCPEGWAMNEDIRCYPRYLKCPSGYWRADDDETGACVPLPSIQRPLLINGTSTGNITDSTGNATDITPQPNATDITPQPNATDTTPPDIPPVNITQSDGSGGGIRGSLNLR